MNRDDKVRLWDAIHAYVLACGGSLDDGVQPEKMDGVVQVERVVEEIASLDTRTLPVVRCYDCALKRHRARGTVSCRAAHTKLGTERQIAANSRALQRQGARPKWCPLPVRLDAIR
jgi:hypothetical protein